jgi:nucleotide-binding universal stress UspA family protein
MGAGRMRHCRSMDKIQRILVPLDGSDLSKTALPMAISLAQKYQAQIILLHAVDQWQNLAAVPTGEAVLQYKRLMDDLYREVEEHLVDIRKKLRQQGLDVEAEIVTQPAAEAIIERAKREDIDLIVMATHGRGGLARWTIGSVADKVLRYGPCPVLLIREGMETDEPMLAE